MNLKQLAEELNLSISAVSKALRDSHEISTATKKIVLAKAKELNYQVNPFASSLRKQKSKTIAEVIPEIANNFFALAINGIEAIAQEKGYHVLIYLTHEDIQKEIGITKLLQNGRVDGIMMSLSEQTLNTDHLEELKQKEIPLVFFDRVAENIDARVFFHPLSSLSMFEELPQNLLAWSIPKRAINFPSFHDMAEAEQDRVVDVIERVLNV